MTPPTLHLLLLTEYSQTEWAQPVLRALSQSSLRIVLNETLWPLGFVLFHLVCDGSLAMHSCMERAIVLGANEAGLIITRGESRPAWTEQLLAVSQGVRWAVMTQLWYEGRAVKVKSQ